LLRQNSKSLKAGYRFLPQLLSHLGAEMLNAPATARANPKFQRGGASLKSTFRESDYETILVEYSLSKKV
jgi:hypothetical protein